MRVHIGPDMTMVKSTTRRPARAAARGAEAVALIPVKTGLRFSLNAVASRWSAVSKVTCSSAIEASSRWFTRSLTTWLIDSLVQRIAHAGPAASSCAISRAVASTSAAGTQWLTRPMRSASRPFSSVPRIRNSLALVTPTSSGQITVPPSPATRPTLLTWLSPMRASSDITVMSHSSAIVAASPMQSPLMAQTIGLSSSSRRLTMRRLIIGSCTSPSSSTSPPGRSDIAFTSPPTLK